MAQRPTRTRRADYARFVPVTTRWMDNDVYGHVNNVVYYSFFDTAVNGLLIEAGALELLGAVDMLVSEKRAQFRERPNLEIVPHLARAFGLFARVSESELSRAISNLVNNAAEAIPGNGRVEIAVYPFGSYVAVEIRDDGPGIPPDLLPKLGERRESGKKERQRARSLWSTPVRRICWRAART